MPEIDIDNRQDFIALPPEAIHKMFAATLAAEQRDAVLSISLVGDEEMTALNARYLDRRAVTDVLAFPYSSGARTIEGEIIVNAELAVRESVDRKHSAEDELMLYLAHGLLHLLGYDDHTPEDSTVMRQRESQVLGAVGRVAEY